MSQYDLLHRLQLFRDRGQPPGSQPTPLLDTHGTVRVTGGRTSPLTEAETSRVRRALFGPVDHAENLRFVQQELARGQKEAERRWNYDFVNDCPVNDPDRRYVWESTETSSRRNSPHIATSSSSSGAEERSGTIKNVLSSKEVSEKFIESVHSENFSSLAQKIGSEMSEKSHDTMSEKILSSKPTPIICPPIPKTKSHPHPCSLNQVAKSSVSISAPATACATPHESPQAGSSKSGSQILPANKQETETKVCDNPQSTQPDDLLSAAATSLSSSSKQLSKTNTANQRSRSKSLHGTQKPITGLFRERKRSKSKSKIASRSLKLQEQIAPSQMSMSNFSVTSESKTVPRARSRSPSTNTYNYNPDK